MNTIDRLIFKAKKHRLANMERFTVGFVDYEEGVWVAKSTLWGGIPGRAYQHRTEHGSMEAAVSTLEALAEKYPNTTEKPVILINSLIQ